MSSTRPPGKVSSPRQDQARVLRLQLPPWWGGPVHIAGRSFEVKARVPGVVRLYRWLDGHFGLVLAADRREPLLVVRLGDFLRACRWRDAAQSPGPEPSRRVSGAGQRPTERS